MKYLYAISVILLAIIGIYFATGNKDAKDAGNTVVMPRSIENDLDPKAEWQILMNTLDREYKKNPENGKTDYSRLTKYQNTDYGILAISWPQSEYIIEIYKYNTNNQSWISCPVKETEFGSEPDLDKMALDWGLPKDKSQAWINDAITYMKNKYGNGDE